jgi:hypothetical protein
MVVITTLAIGADYKKALAFCLDSKKKYVEKHGYQFILGDEKYWNRQKPIAWSKIDFLLDVCASVPEGTLIFQSDADVLITNDSIKIEDQVVPLLDDDKDMLLTLDSCGHINSGNILFRNTAWARDYWKRVGEQKQFTYHIWWENAAMIYLYENNSMDNSKIQITNQHKKFNAYLRGLEGQPLWTPGDFLVHFAGVYDLNEMKTLADRCLAGEVPRLSM